MHLRPVAVLCALAFAVSGLALAGAPDVADAAGNGDTVFIDDALQSSPLGAQWTASGYNWTPAPRTIAQNNTMVHSNDTAGCNGADFVCLATYDAARDGYWLTMTSDNTRGGLGETGFVLHNDAFSSARGVIIEYDQRVYRTNDGKSGGLQQGGGDGISLFLVDANPPDYDRAFEVETSTLLPGGYGAALGYSSVASTGDAWCPVQPGLAGAYLGIGFDVYGNFQKAESQPGFVTNRATRPRSVSDANPTAVDARLPQSIGLRGSGVRFKNAASCIQTDQTQLERAYGMLRVAEVNNPGYATFYSTIWDAGSQASDYEYQYKTSDGVWHNWFDMEPSTRGGTTSGYMQARVAQSAMPVVFAIRKKSDHGRYSETPGLRQDAIVNGATATILYTGETTGGYRWLAGTGSHGSTTTGAWIDNVKNDARQYRRVRVSLMPRTSGARELVVSWSNKLSVADDVCVDPVTKEPNGLVGAACAAAGGEWRLGTTPTVTEQFRYNLADNSYQAGMPAQFRLGFAASTGWAVNHHQIRNLRVTSPTDLAVTKSVARGAAEPTTTWVDDVTGQAGDSVSYRLSATNEGTSPLDPAFPATLTDPMTAVPYANPAAVTWTASATGGAQVWDAATSAWVTTLSGTGPLTEAAALRWHSPDRTTAPTAAVVVTVTGTISTAAAAGNYPNTARVTVSGAGGPQESNLANNEDAALLRLVDGDTWRVSKSAQPASGTVVTAGTEITYTVTAAADGAPGRGDVREVVLTDDLSDALDDATFVAGSATLAVGTADPLPVPDPAGMTLTTAPVDIPHGQTAVLTYRVRVAADVAAGTRLRNVVVGDSTTGDPESCALPADPEDPVCATTHTTPAWTLAKTVADASQPGTSLPDGTLVQPGTTLIYTVTATNAAPGAVEVTLSDDLADLLDDPAGARGPKATFVPGSVNVVVAGTPGGGTLPAGPDASHRLTVGPLALPAATTTGGTTTPTTAVLTYRVTVATDAWATTLRNAVTGAGTDPVGGSDLPPLECTPTDPCATEQLTPALLQVEKRGEDLSGTVVPMDGSSWALYADPELTTVAAESLDPVAGATGLVRTQIAPGTYWLVETRSLPGFQLLPAPLELTVAADGTVTLAAATSHVAVRDDTADDHAWTVVVQDIPALALPETGGVRPLGLVAIGLLLTLLAGGTALRVRRRSAPRGS
ncbi:DUF7927 domain-containing protein [Sanguibacter sp. A247]|uniref:DUF7927 domain-containing protein n=1 Tax=unclassified Sanguibacter TaxID=2645534 RepID=UPI003FD7B6C5